MREQGPEIQLGVYERQRIRFDNAGLAGKAFEAHGGLAFKGDLAGEAEERGSGIEKAADGCSGKRPEAFADEFERAAITGGKREGLAREVGQIVASGQAGEETGSGLDRKFSGGVASRKKRG